MTRQIETIKDVVTDIIQEWATQKERHRRNSPELWMRQLFAPKERRHIKFSYFNKGVLGVKVESASWLYYFNLHREDLLARLRKKSGTIKDIRLFLGEIK